MLQNGNVKVSKSHFSYEILIDLQVKIWNVAYDRIEILKLINSSAVFCSILTLKILEYKTENLFQRHCDF